MLTRRAGVRQRWPRFVTTRPAPESDAARRSCFVACTSLTTLLDGYTPIGLKDAVIPFVSVLPAGLAGARRGRVRPAARARRHEPAARADRLPRCGATSTGSRTRPGRSRSSTRLGPAATPPVLGCASSGVASIAVVVLAVLARFGCRPPAGGSPCALRAPRWRRSSLRSRSPRGTSPAQPGTVWARAPAPRLRCSRAGRATSARRPGRASRALTTPLSTSRPGSPERCKRRVAADGLLAVVIRGRVHGGAGGSFRIDLVGQPLQGGVSLRASGVSYVPAGTRTVYLGSIGFALRAASGRRRCDGGRCASRSSASSWTSTARARSSPGPSTPRRGGA